MMKGTFLADFSLHVDHLPGCSGKNTKTRYIFRLVKKITFLGEKRRFFILWEMRGGFQGHQGKRCVRAAGQLSVVHSHISKHVIFLPLSRQRNCGKHGNFNETFLRENAMLSIHYKNGLSQRLGAPFFLGPKHFWGTQRKYLGGGCFLPPSPPSGKIDFRLFFALHFSLILDQSFFIEKDDEEFWWAGVWKTWLFGAIFPIADSKTIFDWAKKSDFLASMNGFSLSLYFSYFLRTCPWYRKWNMK